MAHFQATYTYDAAGQRTSSVVRQGSVTTTSTYTYEGLTLLSLDAESTEGTAAASWRIDYLADSTGRPYGGIYTSSETSPVVFGIVTTDRGDVRELTDGEGTPFARYDHDAYGNPTRTLSAATAGLDAATAESIAGRNILRYAGYAFDGHSGLYYLSQRYYDPATCQFITKDPAKADGEESAYQYCGGDPVGKVDPSGEVATAIRPLYEMTVTTPWKSVSAAAFAGGSIGYEYRLKIVWIKDRMRRSGARITVSVRNGHSGGGNFSVRSSRVVVTAVIAKPGGSTYRVSVGQLDYGITDPGYEPSLTYKAKSRNMTTNLYSTYWVKAVSATAHAWIVGGVTTRASHRTADTYRTNYFGATRGR